MPSSAEVTYTRHEILDYLPGGWVLMDPSTAGSWNPEKHRWEVTLLDTSDVDWQLQVPGKTAEKSGRIEALREAIDQLYRGALG